MSITLLFGEHPRWVVLNAKWKPGTGQRSSGAGGALWCRIRDGGHYPESPRGTQCAVDCGGRLYQFWGEIDADHGVRVAGLPAADLRTFGAGMALKEAAET